MKRVFFKERLNGYDKKQVDNYIRKLMKAYQATYADYLDAFDKYCVLSEKINREAEQ